jgi:uncharacterized membrane protein
MSIFSFLKPKLFFTTEEQQEIASAIREAEKRTSGEIRIFIESRCRYVEPLDRAAELFFGLKMDKTRERNAVLIYIAIKDHQLAIFADEGIHKKTGQEFWQKEVRLMLSDFNKENYAAGLAKVVSEVGEALYEHFPFDNATDKNELPDDIVFGK